MLFDFVASRDDVENGKPDVEAAWNVVGPILDDTTPVHEYDPHTWGPAEADGIIAGDGGWHNPTATVLEK